MPTIIADILNNNDDGYISVANNVLWHNDATLSLRAATTPTNDIYDVFCFRNISLQKKYLITNAVINVSGESSFNDANELYIEYNLFTDNRIEFIPNSGTSLSPLTYINSLNYIHGSSLLPAATRNLQRYDIINITDSLNQLIQTADWEESRNTIAVKIFINQNAVNGSNRTLLFSAKDSNKKTTYPYIKIDYEVKTAETSPEPPNRIPSMFSPWIE